MKTPIEIKRYKYGRTPHLPWSPGKSEDDILCDNTNHFVGKIVVVSTKLDGENTTMYRDMIHARSIDSGYHPSRTWVQNMHGNLRFQMNEEERICGENMYWVHSIVYTDLPSYFLVFSIWHGDVCLSWADTVQRASELELKTVPVLYTGVYDEKLIKSLYTDDKRDTMEGYVIRLADGFHINDFQNSIAKFVRLGHVQTDEHWMRSGGELNMIRVKK
jgi:hypothetical protein